MTETSANIESLCLDSLFVSLGSGWSVGTEPKKSLNTEWLRGAMLVFSKPTTSYIFPIKCFIERLCRKFGNLINAHRFPWGFLNVFVKRGFTKTLNWVYTATSSGCNLWLVCGGKVNKLIPFARQNKIVSRHTWDSWFSNNNKLGLDLVADIFFNMLNDFKKHKLGHPSCTTCKSNTSMWFIK